MELIVALEGGWRQRLQPHQDSSIVNEIYLATIWGPKMAISHALQVNCSLLNAQMNCLEGGQVDGMV